MKLENMRFHSKHHVAYFNVQSLFEQVNDKQVTPFFVGMRP